MLLEALIRGIVERDEFEEPLERLASAAGLPLDLVAELKRIAAILRG